MHSRGAHNLSPDLMASARQRFKYQEPVIRSSGVRASCPHTRAAPPPRECESPYSRLHPHNRPPLRSPSRFETNPGPSKPSTGPVLRYNARVPEAAPDHFPVDKAHALRHEYPPTPIAPMRAEMRQPKMNEPCETSHDGTTAGARGKGEGNRSLSPVSRFSWDWYPRGRQKLRMRRQINISGLIMLLVLVVVTTIACVACRERLDMNSDDSKILAEMPSVHREVYLRMARASPDSRLLFVMVPRDVSNRVQLEIGGIIIAANDSDEWYVGKNYSTLYVLATPDELRGSFIVRPAGSRFEFIVPRLEEGIRYSHVIQMYSSGSSEESFKIHVGGQPIEGGSL